MCQVWGCGAIVWGVPLVGGVLGSPWGRVLELVKCFLYINCHVYVQYACLVVPVKFDATVENPCPILCAFIFLLECMYEVQ